MSITVNFYKITDDALVLNKDITGDKFLATKTCTIKAPCDVLAPVVVLRWDSDIAQANYMQIDSADFANRFYFITPPQLKPGKRMQFIGSVDPLMSWSAEISALSPLVARNETAPTDNRVMLADAMRPAYCDSMTDISIIGDSTFGGNSYVMLVAGGVKNDS